MNRKSESRWTVPNSWVWTKLSALGDIVAGGTPSTKEPTYWADEIAWISPADLTGYSAKTIVRGAKSISRIGLENSSAKVMPAGSVHFSSRAPIGHVVISSEPIATNQGFKSLVPAPGIFNDYVYYYLMASRDYARERGSGTTFLELSGSAFGELPVPLAPTATQYKVVAKIEELFSELDKGIESLKTARAKLNVYRQAVLKHAFEGKLTAQWREVNKDTLETPEQLLDRIKKEREARYVQQLEEWKTDGRKHGKPKTPKSLSLLTVEEIAELPELPEGWNWLKLANVCIRITDGEHFRPPVTNKGVYFLSAKDVRENGVNFNDPLYISQKTAEKAFVRCNSEYGDILMVSRGATVGRTCVVRTHERFCLLGSVILIKLGEVLNNLYLSCFLRSSRAKEILVKLSGSTAQQAIYLRDIKSLNVPVCSLSEQQEIARLLQGRFTELEQQEQEIDSTLKQAEALRLSILQKAFSGQLVPQDSDDEPASSLLERIKAEKTARSHNNSRTRRRHEKATA